MKDIQNIFPYKDYLLNKNFWVNAIRNIKIQQYSIVYQNKRKFDVYRFSNANKEPSCCFSYSARRKKSQLPSGRHFENVLKIDLIWRPLHNTWHAVWMCLFSFSLISRWNCLFLSFQFLFGSLGTHTKSTQVLLEYSASIRDLQAKSEKKNASHKSSTCHRGGSIQGLVLPFYYLTKLWNINPPFLSLSYCGDDQQDVCTLWCHSAGDFWT